MVLPVIQETTEQTAWTDEHFLTAGFEWADVPNHDVFRRVSEILGYEIEKELPAAELLDAKLIYESIMDEKLGYILEESPSLTPLVQQALDEIASGQTTVVHSAEELEEHLRGEGQSD